jgi:hypothetical protein
MARDVARRGVGRTEVDDDLVPPPKYLERRGMALLGDIWAGAGGLLLGWVGLARQATAGLLHGLHGQVSISLIFSLFLFLLL